MKTIIWLFFQLILGLAITLFAGCASVQERKIDLAGDGSVRITLLGTIARPGVYYVRPNACLADIIKVGGGLVIIRGGEAANTFLAIFQTEPREGAEDWAHERGPILRREQWQTPLSEMEIDLARYPVVNVARRLKF